MKIIIEIKETATLERIAEFGKQLDMTKSNAYRCPCGAILVSGFTDVIAGISKEW